MAKSKFKPIKSCLKIWGGKNSSGMAEWVVSHFPPRDQYHTLLDGCFGGGSVTLAHDPTDKSEVACDVNLMLTNFWGVLQDDEARAALINRLNLVPFSQIQFDNAFADLSHWCSDGVSRLDVNAAVDFFIVARQSFVGRQKTFAVLTKTRTRGGMNEQVSAWLSAVDRLPEVAERLRRVLVLNGPIETRLEEFDREGVVIYADPPYCPTTRTDPTAYGENDTPVEWHHDFLARLRTVEHAKVLVSGNPNPVYDQGLPGWNKVSKKVADASSGAKTKRIREETLWMNY